MTISIAAAAICKKKKRIRQRAQQIVSATRFSIEALKSARTRSNEPSRQSAIDQPHFREISPWKRRRMNCVTTAARVWYRARNSMPREHHRHNSLVPFPFLFIDVSSARVHLLIRMSCNERPGSVAVSSHALLLRQENYRDPDIETLIGTQRAKTKGVCRWGQG